MGTGDREALGKFLTDYGPQIRRRVRGKLRASMRRLFDSQDILSTVSRRLDSYVRAGKFVARSEDEFWSMVLRVAHNSVVEKARVFEALRLKEGEDSAFAALMLGRMEGDAPATDAGQASTPELEEVLALLSSEEDRTIARLWATGSNLAQIASHLGVEEAMVRQRWSRIRRALRASLEGGNGMRLASTAAHGASQHEHPEDLREFLSVLESSPPSDDSALADMIEADGRLRLGRGLACGLDRYRTAVPDLAQRPISLDAAIDVCLRSMAREDGFRAPQDRHAQRLIELNPELSGPIRLAALLGNRLLSTAGVSDVARKHQGFALPKAIGQALETGEPRYELIRALGEGSNGRVYEAVDRLLSDAGHPARVAVKIIAVDVETIHRQTAEATKARRIEHPCVARVLDRGLTSEGELFLVYELVAGGDLHAWFEARGRTLDLRTAAALVGDVATGIQAAHSAGLVHCDLKPSNVLISPSGQPRVTDFGVAALTSQPDGTEGSGQLPMGNLAFAAPEQVRQSGLAASPLVDVYALGGLLYYLATGRLPNGSSPEAVLRTHRGAGERTGPPSIREVRPECDRRLDSICARAMQARPEDRYATAAEMASDLRSWLERRPIAWMGEGVPARTWLWMRRSPGVALLAAACILITLAGAFVGGYYSERVRKLDNRVLANDRSAERVRQIILDKRNRGETITKKEAEEIATNEGLLPPTASPGVSKDPTPHR